MSSKLSTARDYIIRPLGDFFDIIKERSDAPLPIYSVTLRDGMQRRDDLGRIIQSDLKSEDNLLAAKNDICYNMMRMWQGASGLATEDCHVSPAYVVCRPKEGLEPRFAAYLLKSEYALEQFIERSQGVTSDRWRLYPEEFLKIRLPIPPLPEQMKIAEILSGIDNHIDGIKKQITALVLLRSSILEQSLKRFADCPVRPLHEITERITVGIVSKPADHYVSKGVPTLRSMNIKEGRIDYRDIRFISKESNEAFKKSMIKKGDILTVRTGAPGTSAVAPADLEGANCVDIILSTPAPGIDSFFLCLQINSASIKSKVFTAQGGLAQQHFNVGEMRDLEVLVPPLEIQRDISCSVNSVKACIDSKDRYKVKLEELKRAMSDDLLSGRKRVTL